MSLFQMCFYYLTTKKSDDKNFSSSNFQQKKYLEFKDYRLINEDLDEVAHHEPPHQNLCCLKVQLFSSPVLVVVSHSPDEVPPEPQRNVSIAEVRDAVRPSGT